MLCALSYLVEAIVSTRMPGDLFAMQVSVRYDFNYGIAG